MDFGFLPDVVLAKVFSYLPLFDKIAVWNTCSRWRQNLANIESWPIVCFSETDFDEYLDFLNSTGGVCDQNFAQNSDLFAFDLLSCLRQCGCYFRRVSIEIKGELSHKFIQTISQVCTGIKHLSILQKYSKNNNHAHYIKPFDNLPDIVNKMLEMNTQLISVQVEDLQFGTRQSQTISIGRAHAQSLCLVQLINSCQACSLKNFMWLVNLKELVINPNHLNFTLLTNLAAKNLRKLRIVANSKTKNFYFEAISDAQWKIIRENGPKLRVYCYFGVLQDWVEKETFFKPSMPLHTLVYSKVSLIKNISAMTQILRHYCDTLEVFVDFSVCERTYCHGKQIDWNNTIDSLALSIVENCPSLHTLALKEVVSSHTVLNIGLKGKNLRNVYLREDMIDYSNGSQMENGMPNPASQSETLCRRMSNILGFDWSPVPKEKFIPAMVKKYKKYVCEPMATVNLMTLPASFE